MGEARGAARPAGCLSRTLRAFASVARGARVVRDIIRCLELSPARLQPAIKCQVSKAVIRYHFHLTVRALLKALQLNKYLSNVVFRTNDLDKEF